MYNTNVLSGKFQAKNPSKYRGDPRNICFRSSWELRVMKYLDSNPAVLEWGSEELVIPYISPVDGKPHRYFPDFWVRARSRDGTVKEMILEVKPSKYTTPPVKKSRITRRYKQDYVNYKVNEAKWLAASEFCDKNKRQFKIITEHELKI